MVAALVAIEGRPWAELGKSRKPLTQNGVARRLRPLGITSENIRIGDKVPKGYLLVWFGEAFSRYLESEGASEPLQRHNADETGTSTGFQSTTPEPVVSVQKCEKSANDGPRSDVADKKGDVGGSVHVGGGNGLAPGLSQRAILDLARWYIERAADQRQGTGDVDSIVLDAGLRAVLAEMVLPEFVELEVERIMDEVFSV